MSQPIEDLLTSTREELIALRAGILRIEEIVRSSYNQLEKDIDQLRSKLDAINLGFSDVKEKTLKAELNIVNIDNRVTKLENNQSKLAWFIIFSVLTALVALIIK